jgi:hypothetical protein
MRGGPENGLSLGPPHPDRHANRLQLLKWRDDPQRAAEIVLSGPSERNDGARLKLLAASHKPNISANLNPLPDGEGRSQFLHPGAPPDDEESEY